jgi:RNA polymerase sigma factor (sigma-70 family)
MITVKLSKDRQKIATDNIKLVYKIAHQNKGYCKAYGIDFEELVSIGTIGLMKAIDAYDPSKGKFGSIAYIYIKGEIQHSFRDGKNTLMRNHRGEDRNYVSSLDAPLKHDSTATRLDLITDDNLKVSDCNSEFIEEYQYCLPQLKWKEVDAIQMSINGLFDYEIAEWLEMSSPGIVALRQKAKAKIASILAKDKNLKNSSSKNRNALPHRKDGVLEIPSFKSTCIICGRIFGRWKTANNPPLCCGGTCARKLANKKVQIGGKTWSEAEFKLLDSLVNTTPYVEVIKEFRTQYPCRSFDAVKTKMVRRYKTIRSTKDCWNMRELARILDIPSDRIRVWIKRGLTHKRSGRIVMIGRTDINDFCFREYARFYGISTDNLAKVIDDPQLVNLCGQIPKIVKRIEYQRLDTKKVYKSLREASRELNMPRPSIVAATKYTDGWIKKSTAVV